MLERTFPLFVDDIRAILPHRYPMLLVDRVLEFEHAKRIVGLKNVSINEYFFEGHFPERPIMPGVLMLEALAQLGVIFFKLCAKEERRDRLIVFAGCDEVKFRRPVVPGDSLRLEMELIKFRAGVWKMSGTALVDGEKAVEGILTAAESNLSF